MPRFMKTLPLLWCLSAGALAQSPLTQTPPTQTPPTELPPERFGVQLGGIPPFLMSAGGYARLAQFGDSQLEGRLLASYAGVPTFGGGVGAEGDVLLSYRFSNGWRVYGGPALVVANVTTDRPTTYPGVGALVGLRGGLGLRPFGEVGVVTFLGGISGPFARIGLTYNF
ncbi:hypothetical protein [Deinococcus sp.]|uniref:hypothetical protein n=1 Tax=Deinococcus sp. TaxID=47478 RepID=UPI0025F81D6C|nr:hypothetical protein [Deinococcus sp.]